MPDDTIFTADTETVETVADTAALTKRINDSQNFISQLQSELAELRTELRSRLSLEELADKVTRAQTQPTTPQDTVPPVANAEPQKTNLQEEVKRILLQETEQERRRSNIEKAKSLLTENFGDSYNNALKLAAAQLGVKESWLTDMAANSPEGLVKLVMDNQPVKQEVRPTAAPRSAVNTMTNLSSVVKKNKTYYDNLRKTDLAAYFSPKVQNEMMREAMEQGASFYEP